MIRCDACLKETETKNKVRALFLTTRVPRDRESRDYKDFKLCLACLEEFLHEGRLGVGAGEINIGRKEIGR